MTSCPLDAWRADDDDDHDHDEGGSRMAAPVVDSGKEAFNPPVEYEVLDLAGLSAEAVKAKLNELGQEGWSLVGAQPFAILRRAKKPEDAKPKHRVGFGL